MIAYCGMDCSKCEGFIATRENDNLKRQNGKMGTSYVAPVKRENEKNHLL